MVRIRMQRLGRTHRPFYRINAIDQRTRRNGRVLEALGHYDPMCKDEDKQVVLKIEEIKAWLAKGAQPSDTVRDMLGRADILDGDMKAQWEADRAHALQVGKCKAALKTVEAANAAIEKMAEDSEADLTPFSNSAKKALNMVKKTVGPAQVAKAEGFASDASKALDAATKANASAKPEPEPAAEEAEATE
jgi:small subunit ribosomal protein S16